VKLAYLCQFQGVGDAFVGVHFRSPLLAYIYRLRGCSQAYIYKIMQAKNRKQRQRTGPPKLYPVRTLILLAKGALETVDKALAKGETRQDFIRAAIAAELKRRE
jgi:hypothetical protein